MRRNLVLLVLVLLASPLAAQDTPASMVTAYDALADTILSVRAAEEGFVKALLDGHYHAAELLTKKGDYKGAAAQIALFANEGDNAIGGVRKRLLEGGHHFNAAGEEQGIFEPGYVVVTREAKKQALEASRMMGQAGSEEEAIKVWKTFDEMAKALLAAD